MGSTTQSSFIQNLLHLKSDNWCFFYLNLHFQFGRIRGASWRRANLRRVWTRPGDRHGQRGPGAPRLQRQHEAKRHRADCASRAGIRPESVTENSTIVTHKFHFTRPCAQISPRWKCRRSRWWATRWSESQAPPPAGAAEVNYISRLFAYQAQNFLCTLRAGFRLYQVLEYVNLKVIEMESCEREFTAERMQNQICVSTENGTAATCHVRKFNYKANVLKSPILNFLLDVVTNFCCLSCKIWVIFFSI